MKKFLGTWRIQKIYWLCGWSVLDLVFTFMYETGVREREMFALTWNDIDFKSGIIRISKSITSKTKVKGYAVTTPKNVNSIRNIDISDMLLKRILEWFEIENKKDGSH